MKGDELPFNNSNLFSNHFLEKRIVNRSEWSEDEKVKKAFKKIKEIYEDQKDLLLSYDIESQLEDNFIKPVLKALGHSFVVQQSTEESSRTPDYAFFPNEDKRREAIKNKGKEDFYKSAVAVGDAKKWNKSLDKKVRGKPTFEFQNPSYQIDFYLRETNPQWAILTNGKKWRIYFQETSYKFNSFYEVDLEDILERGKLEEFKYFYFFFRLEAFLKDLDEKTFLDEILNKSIKYAEAIGEDLEKNVYEALKWMAEGYLSMKTNRLERNKKNLELVHKNSLIFLYRLLFLFYAESQGLLGKNIPKKYKKEFSFSTWVEDVLDKIKKGEVSHQGGLFNHRLFRIFELVDRGSEDMGISKEEFYVPAYNGGLFSTEENLFLSEKKIQDGYIAKVVEFLAKTKSKEHKGKGRIDYSDLSVRHLGGIYEGLLEYKLKIAKEDLAAIKKKGKQVWIPKSKAKKKKIYDEVEEGEVYLVTDKGERKATGSYYTPDYIVKYIVENTIGPVIKDKMKEIKNNGKKKEAILSTRVLDPAMGSGHFLVEATDFLAQKLIPYLEEENGEEADIEWAKREIIKRCIYGVDLNPLSVELAKVSLWLNTLSKEKPLSFLDHHLRTGNSLIGADIKEMGRYPTEETEKKNNLWSFFGKGFHKHIDVLLDHCRNISKTGSENIDDIRKQEEIYLNFRNNPFRKRFEELANLYTSYYFGNKFSKEEYQEALEELEKGDKWEEVRKLESFEKAQKLAKEKNFFHWKLEFLEVFFDLKRGEKENPGFDVVIGNPPYIRIQNMSHDTSILNYFEGSFYSPYKNYDIYILFTEQGWGLLRKRGFLGYIQPNKYFKTDYGEKIRDFLVENESLFKVVDFSENQIFQDATTYTCVNILSKRHKESFEYIKIKNTEDPHDLREKKGEMIKLVNLKEGAWDFKHYIQKGVFDKLKTKPPLSDFVKEIYTGTQTSDNEIYVVKKEKSDSGNLIVSSSIKESFEIERGILRKWLSGRHIKPYHIEDEGYFVICPYEIKSDSYELMDLERIKEKYPKAYKYLIKLKERLLKRDGISKENWYGFGYPKNMDKFIREKIICPGIAKKNSFAIDKEKFFFKGAYCFPVDECKISKFYLLGLLNSKLLTSYVSSITSKLRGGYFSYFSKYINPIPIHENMDEDVGILTERIWNLKKEIFEERKLFLRWLSGEWGVKIDNLSLKSHLKDYWKYEFKEIRRIARRNKDKIKGDPLSREFVETLEKEWEKSCNKIRLALDKIQNSENRIDAIVFKLYDLTEDEIIRVFDSLNTEDKIKEDILSIFQDLK